MGTRDSMPDLSFLPADPSRWDQCPGGDALVIPIWSDIRPLRGVAGLLDWRLCGRLSQLLRDGRVSGAPREKLLLVTGRIPWKRLLVLGLGASVDFDEHAFRDGCLCGLQALRGIAARNVAIALPGRDRDAIRADHAVRTFLDVLAELDDTGAPPFERLSIIDTASATKTLAEAYRATVQQVLVH